MIQASSTRLSRLATRLPNKRTHKKRDFMGIMNQVLETDRSSRQTLAYIAAFKHNNSEDILKYFVVSNRHQKLPHFGGGQIACNSNEQFSRQRLYYAKVTPVVWLHWAGAIHESRLCARLVVTWRSGNVPQININFVAIHDVRCSEEGLSK